MDPAARIRLLVHTTLFGALWGITEMLLGSYFHMIRFPLTGAVMAAVGSVILCAARLQTDRPGATIAAGVVAAAVRLLGIGAFSLGPVAGMLIEAAILEAVLTVFGCGRPQFIVGCVLACLEGIPHFFITNWLFFGKGIFVTYLDAGRKMQGFFGLPDGFWKVLVALWLAAHLVLGLAAGALAAGLAARRQRAR
jgi:hypothetical protein